MENLVIHSRNIDGVRLEHSFSSPDEFLVLMEDDDECLGDNEILLVALGGLTIYSSLGVKVLGYADTLRTMDVYDWFSSNENVEAENEDPEFIPF